MATTPRASVPTTTRPQSTASWNALRGVLPPGTAMLTTRTSDGERDDGSGTAQLFWASQVKPSAAVPPWIEFGADVGTVYEKR